jgi:hypothetical protein
MKMKKNMKMSLLMIKMINFDILINEMNQFLNINEEIFLLFI